YLFFFFSSRRRHTRFSRDWSSDVCSSDLPSSLSFLYPASRSFFCSAHAVWKPKSPLATRMKSCGRPGGRPCRGALPGFGAGAGEIGRASCREGGKMEVVGAACTKKKETGG